MGSGPGRRPEAGGLTGAEEVTDRGWPAATIENRDSAVAEFNLAAAIGRLIAPELNLPVQLYDMERHYKAVKDKWYGFGGGLKE